MTVMEFVMYDTAGAIPDTCRPRRVQGIVVVQCSGELDLETAELEEYLVARVRAALAAPRLVLDFRGVTFMDASGSRLLDRLIDAAHDAGVPCSVLASAPVWRVMRVLGRESVLAAAPETAA
jgi:anti-anti-sigma factor